MEGTPTNPIDSGRSQAEDDEAVMMHSKEQKKHLTYEESMQMKTRTNKNEEGLMLKISSQEDILIEVKDYKCIEVQSMPDVTGTIDDANKIRTDINSPMKSQMDKKKLLDEPYGTQEDKLMDKGGIQVRLNNI